MTFRRLFYRAALVVNAVLLIAGAASAGLTARHSVQPPSQPASLAAGSLHGGLTQGASAPLQLIAPPMAPVAPAQPQVVQPQMLQNAAPPPPPAIKERIRANIMGAISSSTAATAGIVVEIEGLGRVFESNADQPLTPASAQKLQTAGVALLKLGPNFQFRTEVFGAGDITPEGMLRGDLVLAGGGDPALGRAELSGLAAGLHTAGVRVVEGGLWGDESRYDSHRYGPGWKSDFVTHESGTLSALAVDRNAYRRDSGFIADPVTANMELFREALKAAGVAVHGPSRPGRPEGALRLLATHYSPPLAALVGTMVRESDNFFAELVLKELGRTIGNPTTQGGAEVVRSTMRSLGVPSDEVHDGSGLSPLNKQSAADALLWLKKMEQVTVAPTFRSALATSCVNPGTLKKRFCGTSSAGQVFGKTGALPGSAVLVGYTNTASGRTARFAFILAGTHSNRQARDAIDRAVMSLRDFQE